MHNYVSKQPVTGLHILGEIRTKNMPCLNDISFVKDKIIKSVARAGLHKLDIAEHVFPTGGYTLVLLLAESHLSLHTWPELQYATLDIFVCNVLKDNSTIAKKLFRSVVKLFNPTEVIKKEIVR